MAALAITSEVFMIGSFLKLIDYALHYLDKRNNLNQNHFDNIIEPLFNDAELIYTDFINTFDKLKKMISEDSNEEELIRFLEIRRLNYLPVRIKVKSLLVHFPSKHPDLDFYMIGDSYIDGIYQLILGGIRISEPGRIDFPGNKRYNIQRTFDRDSTGCHTLLDILYIIINRGIIWREGEVKLRLLEAVQHQEKCLHAAWHLVTQGYADKKMKTFQKK